MKTNCWLVTILMAATSAIAQTNATTLPDMPAPASPAAATTTTTASVTTNARPVARGARTSRPVRRATARPSTTAPAASRAAVKESEITLVPGPAEVTVSNLIVRGQAGLKGEVVAHLMKGDTVTVLSQITLAKHAADEPAHWAKIAYPANTPVWVSAKYIDAANNAVVAKKLNLRAGAGENFSIVGVLEQGAKVNPVSTKGGWMKIEAPSDAYAFVAAMYLKAKEAAPTPPAPTPLPVEPAPTPTPTPVPEATSIVTTPPAPPVEITPAPTPEPAPVVTTPPVVPVINPNVPRIVAHEGVVRGVGSLVAPSDYLLYDPRTDVNVDFLLTTTTNLNLSRYVGMRIIVTGQEELDTRWKDTPVLTVQKINVLDTNAVPRIIYRSPRQSQLN